MKMSSSSEIHESLYRIGSNLLLSFCWKLRRGKMINNLTDEFIRSMDELLIHVFKLSGESNKMFLECFYKQSAVAKKSLKF